MVMSGVDDGTVYEYRSEGNGKVDGSYWSLTIGRQEENDICLKYDTFLSRRHGALHWRDNRWWLEDRNSRNGTFLEDDDDFFEEVQVEGEVPIEQGKLFKVGKTWLRIQVTETYGRNTPEGHSD